MNELVMLKSHAGRKTGAKVHVLAPGEEIKPNSVDAQRAQTMVSLKIAEWSGVAKKAERVEAIEKVEVPNGEEG